MKNRLITDPIERRLLEQIQPISMDLQNTAMQIVSHPIAAMSTIFYVIVGAIAYGRLRDLAELCAKFVDDQMPEYRSGETLKQGGALAAYRNTQVYIDNALAPIPPTLPAAQAQPETRTTAPPVDEAEWPIDLGEV